MSASITLTRLVERLLKNPTRVYYVLCIGTKDIWTPIPERTFNTYIDMIHELDEEVKLKLQTHNAAFTFSNKVHRS